MSENVREEALFASIQHRLFDEITAEKIRAILEEDVVSAAILTCFERTADLDDKNSPIIVNVITRKLLGKDLEHWYDDHYKLIAVAIHEIFPSETISTYYVPASGKGCSGRIPDAFRNLKFKIKTLLGTSKKRKANANHDINVVKTPKLTVIG